MTTPTSNAALESTLLEHREQLLGFVRSRVSDAQMAEDILHDSLMKAMGSFDQLDDEDKVVAWFYQILRNAIIDRQRRKKTQEKYVGQYAREAEIRETPEERANVCQCFRKLIPTLKDEYQEMIETMELGEAETEELAAQLGITPNNLNVRRHRARKQLKGRIEETCGACAARGCLDCTCGH
ncbi:sigma-70 family RNA polymerase sigma factor [Lujinxingia vulgaris]|uniref:Sigma-70 family RNA polymerase sigma factor n=1 Tax=Lujinxingia vulgaris TaxID=2600176 RepID=A0A5C6XB98_9DELT|nr:sigma-70 family RNA polymerase sigma factor [Lujinxingia vulgaris]TXD36997.1 sigma-70 family RNA polymerase sigma factor [Lujinxingia vulgaris]